MNQKTANSFQNNREEDYKLNPVSLRPLRPLQVLEQLTRTALPLTLAQLAAQVQVPKSTLLRLLKALEENGYVQHMAAERGYVPGPRAAKLALQTLRGERVSRDCRAVLQALVDKVGETCNLTTLDNNQVRYIERVETHHPLRMVLDPGAKVPLHCTASGKLFLATMPLLERRNAMAGMALERRSPHTFIDAQALERELERIAKHQIGVDNEEFVHGMVAVAVPVYAARKQVIAAIACHAPTARVSMADLLEWVPRMRRAAEAITAALLA